MVETLYAKCPFCVLLSIHHNTLSHSLPFSSTFSVFAAFLPFFLPSLSIPFLFFFSFLFSFFSFSSTPSIPPFSCHSRHGKSQWLVETSGLYAMLLIVLRCSLSFCLFLFRSVAWTFPFSKRRSRRFSAYPFIFKSFSLSGNDTWKHFKRPWKNFSRFFPEPCRRCNSYSCNSFSRPGFRHPWLSLWYSCKWTYHYDNGTFVPASGICKRICCSLIPFFYLF